MVTTALLSVVESAQMEISNMKQRVRSGIAIPENQNHKTGISWVSVIPRIHIVYVYAQRPLPHMCVHRYVCIVGGCIYCACMCAHACVHLCEHTCARSLNQFHRDAAVADGPQRGDNLTGAINVATPPTRMSPSAFSPEILTLCSVCKEQYGEMFHI